MVINGPEFARNGEVLHGKIAVASLSRLQGFLHSEQGMLDYELSGYLDREGRPAVRCVVRGTLQLTCQRCLSAFAYPVSITSELLLVENEGAIEQIDEDGSIDAVVAAPDLDPEVLVEDEVLLDIPMSPRHPQTGCKAQTAGSTDGGAEGRKPFAALAALKKWNG